MILKKEQKNKSNSTKSKQQGLGKADKSIFSSLVKKASQPLLEQKKTKD
jgi:hypothetical protein